MLLDHKHHTQTIKMLNLFITKTYAYTALTDNVDQFAQRLTNKPFPTDIQSLINFLFYVGLAVIVVLAVFGIVRGGYLYLVSADSASNKDKAKKVIQAALGGLLLGFGSWLILNTINPDILKFDPEYEHNQLGEVGIEEVGIDRGERDRLQNAPINYDDGINSFERNQVMFNSAQFTRFYGMTDEQLKASISTMEREEFMAMMLEAREVMYSENRDGRTNDRLEIFISRISEINSNNGNAFGYSEVERIFDTRRALGFYDNLVRAGRAPILVDRNDFNLNLGNHSALFLYGDTQSINRLYSDNGGHIRNNTYSASIVEALNSASSYGENYQTSIENIRRWVNQNGQTIGITRTENGYQLSN